jgi:hypothetical protein
MAVIEDHEKIQGIGRGTVEKRSASEEAPLWFSGIFTEPWTGQMLGSGQMLDPRIGFTGVKRVQEGSD